MWKYSSPPMKKEHKPLTTRKSKFRRKAYEDEESKQESGNEEQYFKITRNIF